MFRQFDQFLDDLLTTGIPGYDCRVLHHGKEVYRRFNGFSDIENKIPMNGKERYNIFSCSKVITVSAALQLWEKGHDITLYYAQHTEHSAAHPLRPKIYQMARDAVIGG